MIKSEYGERISPRRKAKEIFVEYLDMALSDYDEAKCDKLIEGMNFNGMTELEILRVFDSMKALHKSIMKRHRLEVEND